MPHIHSKSSRPATAVLVLVLASLALAACGGSSSTSTTTASTASTSASATTPTTGGKPGAPGGRFTAIRECLKKNGITLPARKPGQRPGSRRLPRRGGGFALPKGVSKAQYEAAIKKCGGFPARGRFAGGASRFDSPGGQTGAREVRGVHERKRREDPGSQHLWQWPGLRHQGHRHGERQVQSSRCEVHEASCSADSAGDPGAAGTGAQRAPGRRTASEPA